MVADFRSEQVADIILECMADFIGIRNFARLPCLAISSLRYFALADARVAKP